MKVLIVFAFCAVTCYAQTRNLVDVPFTETRTMGGGNRNGNFGRSPQQQPQTLRQNFGRNSQTFFQPQQPIQRRQPQSQIRGQNWGRMTQTPAIVQQPRQWQQSQNRELNFKKTPQTFPQPRPQSRSRANNNNNTPAQVFLVPFNLDNLNTQPVPVPRTRNQPIRGSSPRRNNRQGTQADPIFEIDASQLQGL